MPSRIIPNTLNGPMQRNSKKRNPLLNIFVDLQLHSAELLAGTEHVIMIGMLIPSYQCGILQKQAEICCLRT